MVMNDLSLEWKKRSASSHTEYSAETVWSQAFETDEYLVYSWKGGWAYSRSKHPLLGKLDGCVKDLGWAKHICQEDYVTRQRLRRWQEYMINNEPPQMICDAAEDV